MFYALREEQTRVAWLFFGGFLLGLLHVGKGLRALWTARRIAPWVPADRLSSRLGLSLAELKRAAEARSIRPREVYRGVDFYAANDFLDASTTLLRPAAPPDKPEDVLLRPASNTETPPEQLLRAADGVPPNSQREDP